MKEAIDANQTMIKEEEDVMPGCVSTRSEMWFCHLLGHLG